MKNSDLAATLDGKLAVKAIAGHADQSLFRLCVVDLDSGALLREFEVRHDFGGHRLSLTSDEKICIVACYEAYGVGAYDVKTGREIWRRKDLKTAQVVLCHPGRNLVFCARENGAAHLLDTVTGDTVMKFRGIRGHWASPSDDTVLVGASHLEIHRPWGNKTASIPRTPRSDELAVVFHGETVIISERRGPVRCFNSLTGALLWSYNPPAEQHIENLVFMPVEKIVVGLQLRHHDYHPPARLVHFDPVSGRVEGTLELGKIRGAEFCLSGTALFDTEGNLYSNQNGEILRRLCFPVIEPPKPKLTWEELRKRVMDRLEKAQK